MFRGVQTGSVDDKGRLKLPTAVKRRLLAAYKRNDIFITSLDSKTVKVYPIQEWEAVEEALSDKAEQGMLKNKILFQANRYGAEESVDGHGRLLVPAILRTTAAMRGPVKIQWQSNHMIVMSEALYSEQAESKRLTADDLQLAEGLGF